jgi:XTP/dITP diphosphohydrolase
VDALDGAPGLYTARYAGPGASNAERWEKLLHALRDTPQEQRGARFRCAVALVQPGSEQAETAEGTCEGWIAFAPQGTGGFGYDPLFYVPEYGCTMAELPPEIKNQISHRARALQAARPLLDALLP